MGKCGEKWIILYFYGVIDEEMLQFLGNIGAKADAKGRIFIPAIFRKRLQSEGEEFLVLRKDIFQDCSCCTRQCLGKGDRDATVQAKQVERSSSSCSGSSCRCRAVEMDANGRAIEALPSDGVD